MFVSMFSPSREQNTIFYNKGAADFQQSAHYS